MKRMTIICLAGLALALALGSGVYAASKISGKTIKVSSLPGNRVKADALGGKQINEAKLAAVPSAVTAQSVAGSFNTGLISASVGETKQMLTLGSFTIEGVCEADTANVVLRTSVDGASAYSYLDEFDNADFDAADTARIAYGADTGNDRVGFYAGEYSGWTGVAPNGAAIFSGEAHAAKDLLGAPCSFMVTAQQLK
jgi:hypothetical protein